MIATNFGLDTRTGIIFSRYRDTVGYYPFKKDPIATRDISVDFNKRPSGDAIDSIMKICGDNLVVLKLINGYEEGDIIARTYRMFLQKEGTFNSEELQILMKKIECDLISKGHKIR